MGLGTLGLMMSGSGHDVGQAPTQEHSGQSVRETATRSVWHSKCRKSGQLVDWLPAGGTTKRKVVRILDRAAEDFQSTGNFLIKRSGMSKLVWFRDPFHGLVVLPTRILLVIFAVSYVAVWMLFGLAWYAVSKEDCGLSLTTYRQAFYLSLETMTTIGYGVDDQYFNNCAQVAPVIICQCLTATLMDTAVLGLLFMRFGLSSRRARTMVFSDMACLQVIDGKVKLKFRMFGMYRSPLLQATLQVYAVQHKITSRGVTVVCDSMVYEDPDIDATGGSVFLGLPLTIVHPITADSPLAPTGLDHDPTLEEMQLHLRNHPYIEVMAFIGGTVEHTGNTSEKRHSYTLDDIFWHRDFVSCTSVDKDGVHTVDFHALHQTVPFDQVEDKSEAPCCLVGGETPRSISQNENVGFSGEAPQLLQTASGAEGKKEPIIQVSI